MNGKILDLTADEWMGMYHIAADRADKAEAENAKLRKVADAAREFISSTGCNSKECNKCDPKYINFCERSGIGRALAELDKEPSRD